MLLATSFLASRLNLQRASWAVRGYRHVHSGLPKGQRRLIMPNGERRFVTFGMLRGEVVILVYTERNDDLHVISLRRAEKYEKRYYLETAKAHSA